MRHQSYASKTTKIENMLQYNIVCFSQRSPCEIKYQIHSTCLVQRPVFQFHWIRTMQSASSDCFLFRLLNPVS